MALVITVVALTVGAIKRLHDHGSSGWWTATRWVAWWVGPVDVPSVEGNALVSVVQALAYFYLLCAMWVLALGRDDACINAYGAPPTIRDPQDGG